MNRSMNIQEVVKETMEANFCHLLRTGSVGRFGEFDIYKHGELEIGVRINYGLNRIEMVPVDMPEGCMYDTIETVVLYPFLRTDLAFLAQVVGLCTLINSVTEHARLNRRFLV